jgi:hypothetical protein
MASIETSAPTRSSRSIRGGDLVGFLEHHLAEHQLAVGGEGRHQIQRLVAGATIVGAARGLAVARH